MDVLVGAGEHNVGEDSEAGGALALGEGRGKGIAVEGSVKHVARGKGVPKPLATSGGGHDAGDHLGPQAISLAGFLLLAADGFAIGCGVHYGAVPPMA